MLFRLFIISTLIISCSCNHSENTAADGSNPYFQIITMGDSITNGIRQGVGHSETYTYYLEQFLRTAGKRVQITRSGIHGETSEGAVRRLEASILLRKPDLVLIMYGTNDAYIDTCQDELDRTARLPLAQYNKNMESIVRRLLDTGIRPVLMTPITMGDFSCVRLGIYRKQGINFNLRLYAQSLRVLADKYRLPLVDHFQIWESIGKKGGNINFWLSDGVHPNVAGNRFIARTIYRVLVRLLCK